MFNVQCCLSDTSTKKRRSQRRPIYFPSPPLPPPLSIHGSYYISTPVGPVLAIPFRDPNATIRNTICPYSNKPQQKLAPQFSFKQHSCLTDIAPLTTSINFRRSQPLNVKASVHSRTVNSEQDSFSPQSLREVEQTTSANLVQCEEYKLKEEKRAVPTHKLNVQTMINNVQKTSVSRIPRVMQQRCGSLTDRQHLKKTSRVCSTSPDIKYRSNNQKQRKTMESNGQESHRIMKRPTKTSLATTEGNVKRPSDFSHSSQLVEQCTLQPATLNVASSTTDVKKDPEPTSDVILNGVDINPPTELMNESNHSEICYQIQPEVTLKQYGSRIISNESNDKMFCEGNSQINKINNEPDAIGSKNIYKESSNKNLNESSIPQMKSDCSECSDKSKVTASLSLTIDSLYTLIDEDIDGQRRDDSQNFSHFESISTTTTAPLSQSQPQVLAAAPYWLVVVPSALNFNGIESIQQQWKPKTPVSNSRFYVWDKIESKMA